MDLISSCDRHLSFLGEHLEQVHSCKGRRQEPAVVDMTPFLCRIGEGVVHKHTQRQYLPLMMSNYSLVAAAAASPEDPYEQSLYLEGTLDPLWGLAYPLRPVFSLGWASEK